jgi:hypothetical protein
MGNEFLPETGQKRSYSAGETYIDMDKIEKTMVKLFSKTICDISYQKKWNIPEEVVIIAAVTGAYYSKNLLKLGQAVYISMLEIKKHKFAVGTWSIFIQ